MTFRCVVGGLSLPSGVQACLCVPELPALSRAEDESHPMGLQLGDAARGFRTASAPQLV